ncbi:alpha-aminoadipic semialdehyde synthase, mitochondrial [Hylaeus anthracinus]|uniref:alpha-aminoadipic semialdehyde synthase, mitochondrial n=1 Tax=Hylaeus anthracinus TaxID=313031 RepID=UPI0023B975F0|nr:alpha-aminoadipic semialdehyde synthase, mitochondrial [Hylaeus anthracinus]
MWVFRLLKCEFNTPPLSTIRTVPSTIRFISTLKGKIIAIRREDQSVWERRAPLAPANVRRLIRAGVKVLIQPSNRRAYPAQSYQAAGALLQEDISSASVIFGVKQVPVDQLLSNKTYCFFSHTIKAQEGNMPLLDAILEKNIRLLDYEKLTDLNGQRVVAFGKYAGVAGMVNILHGLGLRLLALGHHTPFMHIGPAHNYRDSAMARQAIRDAGYEIALGAMPKSIGPLTFVFTGSGNVSQGGQELFQELPHEYVPPEMLKKVAEHGDTTKIYGCEVRRRHHLERKEEGGGFDPEEYDKHPEKYISTFSKKIAPYASVIINGIYWAVDSPKLLTLPDAKYLLRPAHTPWLPISVGAPALPHRMLAICDISADPGGSIEFMNECTTIDTPFCLYDADRNKDTKSFKGPGVLVCSIDNMPTQLPKESTDFFGNLLYPYVLDIIQSDAKTPLEEHHFSPAVHSAIIASNGRLTANFEYIQELRLLNKRSKHKADNVEAQNKTVVVLGAGYVSAPLVEYLHRASNIRLIVASQLKEEADMLASKFPGVEAIFLNVLERPDTLKDTIDSADVVVSLLPYNLHHVVAKACISTKTHLVTASYLNEDVKALHDEAVAAEVTILNEIGLDPGIDHLLALECFDSVKQAGGKIESFVSWCGGLPAPECSSNPLRYKFSWSPRGVLLNTLASARYYDEQQVVDVPAGGNLMTQVQDLDFLPGFALEGYPNRDSTIYKDFYGINSANTVLRGTLRFKGFCNTIRSLQYLGLIDPNPHPSLHPNGPDITWRMLVCNLLGLANGNIFYGNLKRKLAEMLNSDEAVQAIEDLGLLKEDLVMKMNTPLDTLTYYLSKKLCYEESERDLVILRHDIGILWPDNRREKRGINLVLYGDVKGHSAMARTVGYPAAIAVKMILDGEIQQRGVVLPFTADIYRPLLNRLKAEGIEFFETSKWL